MENVRTIPDPEFFNSLVDGQRYLIIQKYIDDHYHNNLELWKWQGWKHYKQKNDQLFCESSFGFTNMDDVQQNYIKFFKKDMPFVVNPVAIPVE